VIVGRPYSPARVLRIAQTTERARLKLGKIGLTRRGKRFLVLLEAAVDLAQREIDVATEFVDPREGCGGVICPARSCLLTPACLARQRHRHATVWVTSRRDQSFFTAFSRSADATLHAPSLPSQQIVEPIRRS